MTQLLVGVVLWPRVPHAPLYRRRPEALRDQRGLRYYVKGSALAR